MMTAGGGGTRAPSDTSDEDVICSRRSGPSESALQDSLFLEPDPEELAESHPRLPRQLLQPTGQPRQQPVQPPPQAQPVQPPAQVQPQQPPAKRARGRPRKPPTEVQPPPKRPPTPKPVLDADQRHAFTARCREREAEFAAFRALRNPSQAQVDAFWSLQVEDEIDRKRCQGVWTWDEFTEIKEEG
ncbi:hypothetical protein HOLleu_03946 [Holothuria leucospilota]|uniref:Uncharacterized protein n=1 Tax=Holothuria leucospilota TaxID=206669 RepID=A0A9Q1CSM0_HOLLE|nr:hypothetical protein HOLleu_03946 [Holothuria leucospilota]